MVSNSLSNLKILVVDDEPANIYLVKDILSDYTIFTAMNGTETKQRLDEHIPDLILLDVMLPGEDGFAIADSIKTDPELESIPIIFLTAKDAGRDVVQGLKTGAVDYIKKPFDPDELLARVEKALKAREHEKVLEKRSKIDGLTGLTNHDNIISLVHIEIERARRSSLPLSLMMIDLDYFKGINDSHGHQAGDQALIELAQQLKTNLRLIDIAGRYGGDEFLVILPNSPLDKAAEVAERIRQIVEKKALQIGPVVIPITLSIGVSSYSGKQNATNLIAEADQALYKSKKAGRNRVNTYSET